MRPPINTYYAISAMWLMLACGCTADSAVEPIADGDVCDIAFFPAPQFDSAPDGVTTTLNIRDFKVTATTRGQWSVTTILDDVIVKRTGSNSWTYSPQIEWPDTPVNFYMVNPTDINWSVQTWDTGAMLWQYHNYGTTDLITAANYDMQKQSGPVRVNFRHALARVSANLRSAVPQEYDVRVKLVYICGVALTGHYTWPTESTSSQNSGSIGETAASGDWSVAGYATHSNEFYTLAQYDDDSGFALVSSDDSYMPIEGTGIQFMIPHELQPSRFDESNWLGANIIVVYNIHRKSDNSLIWPNQSTPFEYVYHTDGTGQWAVAPFALGSSTPDAQWLAGLNYVYRLTLNMPQMSRSSMTDNEISCTASFY